MSSDTSSPAYRLARMQAAREKEVRIRIAENELIRQHIEIHGHIYTAGVEQISEKYRRSLEKVDIV